MPFHQVEDFDLCHGGKSPGEFYRANEVAARVIWIKVLVSTMWVLGDDT
jgi:hypothetical protein